ncbi:MAG: Na/Pi cotransporter family protein [Synergistetes bacterium]|nr:Na/Pi cotransporter family protein [Synergistota bacterium]
MREILFLPAGLSLFLFGIRTSGEGLKELLGGRLKRLFESVSRYRSLSLLVGVLLSVAVQSSTAATSLLASMINAGILTFLQSVDVMIGASLGTTITTQILAFKVSSYSPYLLFIGYIMSFWLKGKARNVGRVIWGFAIVFFGMLLTEEALSSIKGSPVFALFKKEMSPLYLFALSFAFTTIFQSSALTLGLALSMASQGLLSLQGAFFVILGAHVAASSTVLLVSLGMRREALALAWSSFIYKALGSVFISLMALPLVKLASALSLYPPRQVALLHLEVASINAILFWFSTSFLVRLSIRFAFSREGVEDFEKPLFLEERALALPEWACYLATKETIRVGEMLEYQLLRAKYLLLGEETKREPFASISDSIFRLVDSVASYVGKVEGMPEEKLRLFTVLGDIKQASGILRDSILSLLENGFQREARGREEKIEEIMDNLSELLKVSLGAFALSDKLMIRKAKGLKRFMEREIREFLITEKLEGNSLWLDFSSFVRRFSDQCYYIVREAR